LMNLVRMKSRVNKEWGRKMSRRRPSKTDKG
jgi:hypothetical protein